MGGQFVLPDKPYEVKQDKKTRELSISYDEQMMLSRMDYYCNCISTNKAIFIPSGRMILSNNYLSFFVAKKDLLPERLTNKIIDGYYQKLKEPYKKYSKKQSGELYHKVEEKIGSVDAGKVQLIQSWVKENIFSLPFDIKGKNSDLIKLFFVLDEEKVDADFKREGERYFVLNVFNSNDYNEKIDDVIYGVASNNISLNSKKPYYEHKSRKSKVPIMEDIDKVILKKKFFDYLMNNISAGNYNIFFPIEEGEKIRAIKENSLHYNQSGYFLRIRRHKDKFVDEAEIIESDTISIRHDKLKRPFEMQNILEIPENECADVFYGKTQDIMQIADSINQIFFSKYLLNNLFNELQDISAPDEKIEKTLVLYRNAYKNWFYMGFDEDMESVIKGTADIVIQNSIDNNYRKVQHQFNLKWSLIEYFRQGEGKMADILKQQRDTIRQKINTDRDVYVSIDNDDEYCYAVGQLVKYFLGLSKTGKKTYSLANPFFNTREDKLLKERLKSLFLKYNYSEDMSGKRFEKLYSMICSYEVENGLNQDVMIAGFISPNLIYEKGDK
jgi:CRISPR-associated protein Csh1